MISDGFKYNLIYLLRDSFLFEANYNATLWCMQQLFLASLVCKALAYIPERLSPVLRLTAAILLIAVLMLADAGFCVWICAAVLGYILRLLLDYTEHHPLPGGRIPLVLMALIALALIKLQMPESVLQYAFQSIAAFLLIYVQFQLPGLQRVLSHSPAPWLGGISIGLFVVHTPINSLLYSSLYSPCLKFMPAVAAGALYFFVSLGLCIFAAWLLKLMYTALSERFTRKPVSV